MALRPYQVDGIAAVESAWDRDVRRPGVNLATGLGKTRMMSHLNAKLVPNVRHARGENPTGHVMTLLHRDTLVHQTMEAYRPDLVPGTSIGMVKAGHNKVGSHSIVASIHTLRSKLRRDMLPPVDYCIVDEAHVSISPTYMDVFKHIGVFDGRCKLVGFSATWSRSSGSLSDVWEDIVYSRSTKWGIDNGFLIPPRAVQVGAGVDLSHARISALTGDYVAGDIELAVTSDELAATVVNGAREHSPNAPTVLFAPTKASAVFFLDALRKAGFTCEAIFDSTSMEERKAIHARHKAGTTNIIGTCLALAEGWDAPYCSRLLLVRPISHEGLFVQIVGRILRLWPGKTEALILDFVRATDDNRLRNAVSLDSQARSCDGESDRNLLDQPVVLEIKEEKKVRVRHDTVEVSLFPESSVVWRTAHGIPYVSMGTEVVALVDTPAGTNVGWFKGYSPDGRLAGRWLGESLEPSVALELADDAAERSPAARLARRTESWRRQAPSREMLRTASARGLATDGKLRGELSDALNFQVIEQQLRSLAQWQTTQI